jgi:CubicO group peptidase (beta-lactamase class C family)
MRPANHSLTLLSGAAIVLFAAAAVCRAEEPPADASQPAIDAFIKEQMDEQHIPGLSLAVTIDNELIFTKGYGLANVELQSPALDESVYEVASLTKQFTAMAILLLAQDGRLALDDPSGKYFPEAPPAWEKITLRRLLTHTSGIPDFDDANQPLDPHRDYTEDELVRLAAALPLKFPPGARWSYSNTAYVLLGVLVHRVSGKPYGEFLRERIFSPLHMGSTRVNSAEDLVPFRASGYVLDEGRIKNQDWMSPTLGGTADGGLVSSVVDLAKWDAAIQSGALLPPARWQEVFSAVTLNSGKTFPYGFGWFIRDQAGHPYYEHSGRLQGFASHILRFPRARVSVIVLANLAQADPWQIAHGVAGIIRPDLKLPEDHPIEDREPAVTALLRQVLEGLRRGELAPGAFTAEGRNAYNADSLHDEREQLSRLPPFGAFELVSRAEVGDDTEYRYWVHVGDKKWLLEVSLETDSGKVEHLDFNPM